ncbi:MAG TPA: 16S rRNA (adenine(1518)-N(6)/adenine(1519)-N(6))-dimethyltransferase RsmA [Verrucomicrobiales bacterium]|nr:16S rRNA (adenine(1518)-N(6)/adenine(1519)-N(6))-dimethyltransferase RsmA [Verrucomicrobiales bacterium]
MNTSELRELLRQLDVVPSRRLGQNFLVDPGAAREIAAALDSGSEDYVVEIGAGTGALSDALAGLSRHLLLIEKDHRLAGHLERRFSNRPDVSLIAGDALRFDTRTLFPEAPVRLAGNLPYSSGGEILRHFLDAPTSVSRAVLMLQSEVCDRITARPGSEGYGILSLCIQAFWEVARLRSVPPHSFHPQPKVESTALVFDPVNPERFPPFDARLFRRLVKHGFAQRRKQLKNLLPIEPGLWLEARRHLGLAETCRAEELDVDTWIALARELDNHPLKDVPQHGEERFDVVDAADQVTGSSTRDEVHRRALLHRAVHVFLFNRRGELFLQKRSRLKDSHPGRWDSSASGHLDSGETYLAAARRELCEELGQVSAGPGAPGAPDGTAPLEEIAVLPATPANGWEHIRLFAAPARDPVRFPSSEIETGDFFPLDVIRRWVARRPGDFAGGFLECFHAYETRAANSSSAALHP